MARIDMLASLSHWPHCLTGQRNALTIGSTVWTRFARELAIGRHPFVVGTTLVDRRPKITPFMLITTFDPVHTRTPVHVDTIHDSLCLT